MKQHQKHFDLELEPLRPKFSNLLIFSEKIKDKKSPCLAEAYGF